MHVRKGRGRMFTGVDAVGDRWTGCKQDSTDESEEDRKVNVSLYLELESYRHHFSSSTDCHSDKPGGCKSMSVAESY